MIWRSSIVRVLTLGVVYGAGAALSVSLSRLSGGFAMLWISTALLIPILLTLPPRRWWPSLLACAGASMVVTGLLGLGWQAAPFLALANCAEAVVAALVIRWAHARFGSYVSPRWMLATYAGGALLAPAASGMIAASVRAADGAPFLANLSEWTLSHALGFVAIFPCAALLVRAHVRDQRVLPPPGQRRAAILALSAVALGGLICFGQAQAPMLFLPLLVVMYTMALTDIVISALGLTILLAMGVASVAFGIGPLQVVAATPAERYLFLQFYTACISLTAMPIAILLERRRRLHLELAESEARYRLLADFSTDIIMVTGMRGEIRYVSPSISQLGDYDPGSLLGTPGADLIAPRHLDEVAAAHRLVLAQPGRTASVEFLGLTRAGTPRWFETRIRAIQRDDGKVDGVCSIIRDIAHRKRQEAELKAVALTDPLTNLANRRAFEMFYAAGEGGKRTSFVALFDLDRFKRVNDRFGHETGDKVLKAFARAARGVVRENDLIARIGGDEFALHLAAATLPQAQLICERICASFGEETARIGAELGPITASVGMSSADGPLAAVLRRADAALYEAKGKGRNQLSIAA